MSKRTSVLLLVGAWACQFFEPIIAFGGWSPSGTWHHQPCVERRARTRIRSRSVREFSTGIWKPLLSKEPLRSMGASEDTQLSPEDPRLSPEASSIGGLQDQPDKGRVLSELYTLLIAATIGICTGFAVDFFKLSIEEVRQFSYGSPASLPLLPLIPALGGVAVYALSLPGAFPPGLKGTVIEVDKDSRETARGVSIDDKQPLRFVRKSLASVCTLGTGNSLGPEGPSVEIGMNVGRVCTNVFQPMESFGATNGECDRRLSESEIVRRNRLLLSCGAAAGVSAGFNAPIAGIFFALEIVEGAFAEASSGTTSGDAEDPISKTSSTITAILLSSVVSALVSRSILGNELALTVSTYSLDTPLLELPLYLSLGAICGVVAFAFSQCAKTAKSIFDGEIGSASMRNAVKSLPNGAKPAIGGLLCGLIGLTFPQILFFGYETLNSLLATNSLSTELLLTLLVVKTISTALAVGSGLVGGTFAPALFLGAMAGGAFHNIVNGLLSLGLQDYLYTLNGNAMQLADVQAYAMVGAASSLAALFRAPLTASLLLFELTGEYDVILPLMASAGVASLVGDIIEEMVEREQVVELRRDKDSVSWGDLSSRSEKK